jgi:hypothetical protein
MRQNFAIVAAAVLGVAVVAGAGKLLYDMKKLPSDAPRPKKPWEQLP